MVKTTPGEKIQTYEQKFGTEKTDKMTLDDEWVESKPEILLMTDILQWHI